MSTLITVIPATHVH